MNRLKNSECYLCGAMDRVADHGVQWREELTPFLENLGVEINNPADKPPGLGAIETGDFREQRRLAKERGDWDAVEDMMDPIVHVDLRMVDTSDFIIVNIDMDQHPSGTFAEMTMAALQRKPIIVHCAAGKKYVPDWWFGHAKHQMFFSTWDEVKSYLNHVNSDDYYETYGRWLLWKYMKS